MVDGVSRAVALLGTVRDGRGAGRFGGLIPAMAVSSCHDGGADHRYEAGDGWDQWRRVSTQDARYGAFPRALEGSDVTIGIVGLALGVQAGAVLVRF